MLLSSSNAGAGFGLLIFIVFGLAFYFLPTGIAILRHVPNVGSVAVVNTFLGWTFIGWIVALAMAARSAAPSTVVNVGPQPGWYPPQPQSQMVAPQAIAPGWYPDPHGQASSRYWDGLGWTQHTQ